MYKPNDYTFDNGFLANKIVESSGGYAYHYTKLDDTSCRILKLCVGDYDSEPVSNNLKWELITDCSDLI